MAAKPVCLVCKKEMEIGFLTDRGHMNVVNMPRWCAGMPEPSWLSGEARSGQVKEGLKVVAYRCPECEALRLYAPAEPKPGQ
ncbi:MAG: PF20097 family protein [Phycisphaerales bacterium]